MQIDNGTLSIELSGELCCTGVVSVRRQGVDVMFRVRDKLNELPYAVDYLFVLKN